MYDKNNRAVIYEEAEPLAFGLKTTQTMRRSGDEDFYGCGMQQGNFSYAGKEADIEVTGWDEDQPLTRLPSICPRKDMAYSEYVCPGPLCLQRHGDAGQEL